MNDLPPCPQCNSEYTYDNVSQFVCPECNHEWSGTTPAAHTETRVWKDASGHELPNGDTVMVIQDLKVRGASSMLKANSKVQNITTHEDQVADPELHVPHTYANELCDMMWHQDFL